MFFVADASDGAVVMADGRPESSANQRWEARARVDYPLHYLIWLREHKLLELKLDSLNSDNDPADQVSRVDTANVPKTRKTFEIKLLQSLALVASL